MEPTTEKRKVVVVLSGGQDSTTCLALAQQHEEVVGAIHFQYGQQHQAEEFAAVGKIAEHFNVPNIKVVDLSALTAVAQSALTLTAGSDVNRPHHLNQDLPASFVPGRNLIMLTLAAVYAQSLGATGLYTGVCETDYSGYPDCRQSTIELLESTINYGLGLEDDEEISADAINIVTPLMDIDKADTFKMANDLGVLDFIIENTHTGYTGDRSKRYEWGYGPENEEDLDPASKIRAQGWETYVERYVKVTA